MLRCWQLIRILVRTNHPTLRVGCHRPSPTLLRGTPHRRIPSPLPPLHQRARLGPTPFCPPPPHFSSSKRPAPLVHSPLLLMRQSPESHRHVGIVWSTAANHPTPSCEAPPPSLPRTARASPSPSPPPAVAPPGHHCQPPEFPRRLRTPSSHCLRPSLTVNMTLRWAPTAASLSGGLPLSLWCPRHLPGHTLFAGEPGPVAPPHRPRARWPRRERAICLAVGQNPGWARPSHKVVGQKPAHYCATGFSFFLFGLNFLEIVANF
jgi:hypothetical protein